MCPPPSFRPGLFFKASMQQPWISPVLISFNYKNVSYSIMHLLLKWSHIIWGMLWPLIYPMHCGWQYTDGSELHCWCVMTRCLVESHFCPTCANEAYMWTPVFHGRQLLQKILTSRTKVVTGLLTAFLAPASTCNPATISLCTNFVSCAFIHVTQIHSTTELNNSEWTNISWKYSDIDHPC